MKWNKEYHPTFVTQARNRIVLLTRTAIMDNNRYIHTLVRTHTDDAYNEDILFQQHVATIGSSETPLVSTANKL